MAETIESLQKAQTFHSLFTALDPKSLILSQFSNEPQLLKLTNDSSCFERGPRYNAYADLREKKLRLKNSKQLAIPEDGEIEDFEGSFVVTPPKRTKGSLSILAQSVPDFSSALRKENRRPPLPNLKEKSMTPPSKSVKFDTVERGSKSVSSLRNNRKSYASVEELKRLGSVARNAINGENRVGMGRVGTRGKAVLGYRQL